MNQTNMFISNLNSVSLRVKLFYIAALLILLTVSLLVINMYNQKSLLIDRVNSVASPINSVPLIENLPPHSSMYTISRNVNNPESTSASDTSTKITVNGQQIPVPQNGSSTTTQRSNSNSTNIVVNNKSNNTSSNTTSVQVDSLSTVTNDTRGF
jgi:hypothetical protein